MQKIIKAEIHVLDRMMDTLSELSVARLVQQDATFATYIGELHNTLNDKTIELRRAREFA